MVKVKKGDGAPPKSDKDLLAEWQEYTSALFSTMIMVKPHLICHNQLLRPIHDHSPTLEKTLEDIRQMKTNKAAGLDCAITAEAFKGGGDAMADVVHCFCAEVHVLKSDTT